MLIKHKIKSSDDSIKYILETEDHHLFECIYMPHDVDDAVVMCLSSQIGCVNKCTHCATGKVDFVRDLTAEEISDEVGTMLNDNGNPNKLLAVLFMGMGEPFLNYDNILKGIDLFEERYGIIDENVTISTVGIIHKIKEFADLNRKIRLAVSVHASSNEMRSRIIPLNKIFNLDSILDAIDYYNKKNLRQVLLQYTLIGNLNDSDEDAYRLAELAKQHNCEIRLIPFNPSPSIAFEETTEERIDYFCSVFREKGVNYVLSRSRGVDVSGGCGQLYLNGV